VHHVIARRTSSRSSSRKGRPASTASTRRSFRSIPAG
jgi:hypothetical protein